MQPGGLLRRLNSPFSSIPVNSLARRIRSGEDLQCVAVHRGGGGLQLHPGGILFDCLQHQGRCDPANIFLPSSWLLSPFVASLPLRGFSPLPPSWLLSPIRSFFPPPTHTPLIPIAHGFSPPFVASLPVARSLYAMSDVPSEILLLSPSRASLPLNPSPLSLVASLPVARSLYTMSDVPSEILRLSRLESL
ncbi:unnamed protein product [Closterium sp. Naga37s-1]|nr:unnamed protein product [Closterium sp. Naga37s-1]